MTIPHPKNFHTLIFDCDGVILDSNSVKTNAFFTAASLYGVESANKLVKYHQNNGGISRYKKFDYFLKEIVCIDVDRFNLQRLLDIYSDEVLKGLYSCKSSTALSKLLQLDPNIRKMVVSGGDEGELRAVFNVRGLYSLFPEGIFGSPETKDKILEREILKNNIRFPALYIGDSRYDYRAAKSYGIDFLFVSAWSEFSEWRRFQSLHGFPFVYDLNTWLSEL